MLNYFGRLVFPTFWSINTGKNKLNVVTIYRVFQPCYFANLFHLHVTDHINVLNSTGSSALIKLDDGRCVHECLPGDFGALKCL